MPAGVASRPAALIIIIVFTYKALIKTKLQSASHIKQRTKHKTLNRNIRTKLLGFKKIRDFFFKQKKPHNQNFKKILVQ